MRNRINPYRLLPLVAIVACLGLAAIPFRADVDRPDPWITMKSKTALYVDLGAPASGINVDTHDRRVTLHGIVESEDMKQRAERCVQAIEGTREVKNLLQVVAEDRQEQLKIEDALIESHIDAAFDADPMLRESGVRVKSVNDGVVLLTGDVETMSEHLRAFEVAFDVDGVRTVSSEVKAPDKLMHTTRSIGTVFADAWVTGKIKSKLIANDDVPALDINVDTSRGIVTLFGEVESQSIKQTAAQLASTVDGVEKVENRLIVRHVETVSTK